MIRKVGTLYAQFVRRIGLRPITPSYYVDNIQLTMDDLRPDPSLRKHKSEQEMFDNVLRDLLRAGKLFDPKLVKSVSKKKKEVEHIRGEAVVPAAPGNKVHIEAQNALPAAH